VEVWAKSVSGDQHDRCAQKHRHGYRDSTLAVTAKRQPNCARLAQPGTPISPVAKIAGPVAEFLGRLHRCSYLKKHIAEIGAMNLRVTHGAGLILRRLIVRGADWPARRQRGRERVALQTEHIHCITLSSFRIGGTVGRMATGAALGLNRHMLVDERTLLIDVALVADEIAARQGP